MSKPWHTIDKVESRDGLLELRQRGDRDFLITIDNRVLMNSSANRSEIALGRDACCLIAARAQPRVLVGGLGMGLTLRAALDALPESATVVVAELNSVIPQWCEGPLAILTENAVRDPRVRVMIDDVATVIAKASSGAEKFDAIIIDLYEGPGGKTDSANDPFYGSRALARTFSALSKGGVFAVWGENPDAAFERRLSAAEFSFERSRPGRGGLRHVVYLAAKRVAP
jgi:spermidine synthase